MCFPDINLTGRHMSQSYFCNRPGYATIIPHVHATFLCITSRCKLPIYRIVQVALLVEQYPPATYSRALPEVCLLCSTPHTAYTIRRQSNPCIVPCQGSSRNGCLLLQAQACSLAEETGCSMQHPMLDRVRQCSANPEQAVLFFRQILSPVPHVRAQAVHHPWIAETVAKMSAKTGTGYEPVDPSQMEGPWWNEDVIFPDKASKAQHSSIFTSCAALLPCCGCFGSPKMREGDQPLHHSQAQHTGQRVPPNQDTPDEHRVKSRSEPGKSECLSRVKAALSKTAKCGSSSALVGHAVPSASGPAVPASSVSGTAQDAASEACQQPEQAQAVQTCKPQPGAAAVNVTAVTANGSAQQQQ